MHPVSANARARPAWLTPSSAALILANLVPLGGVLFFGWRVFPIMLLFWLENVVIGLSNLVKLLAASPRNRTLWAEKALLVPFFCFHYGIFCQVHGAFVISLFGHDELGRNLFPSPGAIWHLVGRLGLGWALLALAASHAVSLVQNYFLSGLYRRTLPPVLMIAPYGRIIVLHIAILFGAFLIMTLDSPLLGLLLLIGGKIALDLKAHLKEHAGATEPAIAQD